MWSDRGFEMVAQHPIEVLDSRGIAIVQASEKDDGFGRAIVRSLRKSGFQGKVVSVNPAGAPRLGLPAYRKVRDVPADVERAIIEVPRRKLESVLKQCIERSIEVLAILTSPDKAPEPHTNRLNVALSDQSERDGPLGRLPRASRPSFFLQ